MRNGCRCGWRQSGRHSRRLHNDRALLQGHNHRVNLFGAQHRLGGCGLAQANQAAKNRHQCVGPQVAWIDHPLLQLRRTVALPHPVQCRCKAAGGCRYRLPSMTSAAITQAAVGDDAPAQVRIGLCCTVPACPHQGPQSPTDDGTLCRPNCPGHKVLWISATSFHTSWRVRRLLTTSKRSMKRMPSNALPSFHTPNKVPLQYTTVVSPCQHSSKRS